MSEPAVEIAILKQRFTDFEARYERDQEETKDHRSEIIRRLDDLNNKEQQAIGAMKMAKVGYWVLGIAATVLSAIGLPKVAAWLFAIAAK